MDAETRERIEQLESSIAHLEHQYDELNEVVLEQGKLLRRLQSALQKVAGTVESAETERIAANNPPPPHSVIR